MEQAVIVCRVGADVTYAARAEIMMDLPAVAISQIGDDCISDRLAQLDIDSLDVYAAIEEVGIDEVGIKRKLFRMLLKGGRADISLMLGASNPDTTLIGEILICLVRMARACSSPSRLTAK